MMKQGLCWLWLLLIPLNTWGQGPRFLPQVFDFSVEQLDGQAFHMSETASQPLHAIFFLSPECPLCENYSLTLRQLRQQFSEEEVAFWGVFSGSYYSAERIQTYLDTYQPAVQAVMDHDYQFQQALDAAVTPEVALLDAEGKVLYQGSIDNWIPALGKKRPKITRHYLQAAIRAAQAGQPILVSQTNAIGCFIE